jgi:hypothetical protein
MDVKLLVSNFKGKRRLKVFENRVLRIIFELKRDEIIGGWDIIHRSNQEFHKLYSSLNLRMQAV